jgi:hypothetical protein
MISCLVVLLGAAAASASTDVKTVIHCHFTGTLYAKQTAPNSYDLTTGPVDPWLSQGDYAICVGSDARQYFVPREAVSGTYDGDAHTAGLGYLHLTVRLSDSVSEPATEYVHLTGARTGYAFPVTADSGTANTSGAGMLRLGVDANYSPWLLDGEIDFVKGGI